MPIFVRALVSCCLLLTSACAACSSDTSGLGTPDAAASAAVSDDASVTSTLDAGVSDASGGSSNMLDASLGSTPASDAGSGADASGELQDSGTLMDAQLEKPPPSVFPAVSDPTEDGPYKTKVVKKTGPSSSFTIFQPQPLGADGVKHPVLTWAGVDGTQPSSYPLLPHLASHGFVVIATDALPQTDMEVALSEEMLKGMDWLLMQNSIDGSAYFGKLDPNYVAPFGFATGAQAAFVLAADPRFSTSVHLSASNGSTQAADRISKVHAPMFWECGAGDVAGPYCEADFSNLTTQAVFYGTLAGADQAGIATEPYATRISGAVTAWFRYLLMADQTYKTWFHGDDCFLCQNTSEWKVQKKNFD